MKISNPRESKDWNRQQDQTLSVITVMRLGFSCVFSSIIWTEGKHP